MDRRNFLEASVSLLTAMGFTKEVEPEWMQQLTDNGEIHGQHFELISPFVVKEEWSDIVFKHCTFSAKPGFVGNKLIEGVISCYGCEFNSMHCKSTESIFIKPPPNSQTKLSAPHFAVRWEYGDDRV